MEITINLDKSVEENAQTYFEKAKKAKKKLLGAKKALQQTLIKLEKQEKTHKKEIIKNEALIKNKQRKKEWYEKFKWFISSNNILVVAGKDASTNEVLIKKHTEPDNLVYHTEMPGSPFTIIKNNKQDIPETTKQEASIFTLIHSKAWEKNIKTIEVWEVKPEQISKQAKAGEYLQKGSFMIHGKKKFYDPIMDLSIGYFVKEDHKIIMAGPKSAISKHCKEYLALKQGSLKKGEISNKIMKKFNLVTNEEILSALPSGKFDIAK